MKEMTCLDDIGAKFLMSKNCKVTNKPIAYLAYELNTTDPTGLQLNPLNYKKLQNAFIVDFENPFSDILSMSNLEPFRLGGFIPLSDLNAKYVAYKGDN